MATNLLLMSEEQFWLATPKKLQALFKVYKGVHGVEDEKPDYIDEILF